MKEGIDKKPNKSFCEGCVYFMEKDKKQNVDGEVFTLLADTCLLQRNYLEKCKGKVSNADKYNLISKKI